MATSSNPFFFLVLPFIYLCVLGLMRQSKGDGDVSVLGGREARMNFDLAAEHSGVRFEATYESRTKLEDQILAVMNKTDVCHTPEK